MWYVKQCQAQLALHGTWDVSIEQVKVIEDRIRQIGSAPNNAKNIKQMSQVHTFSLQSLSTRLPKHHACKSMHPLPSKVWTQYQVSQEDFSWKRQSRLFQWLSSKVQTRFPLLCYTLPEQKLNYYIIVCIKYLDSPWHTQGWHIIVDWRFLRMSPLRPSAWRYSEDPIIVGSLEFNTQFHL